MDSEKILGIIILIISIIIGTKIIFYLMRLFQEPTHNVDKYGNTFDKAFKNTQNVVGNNLTKVKKFAERTISKSYLTGCSWLLINDDDDKIIYTFRDNYDLLVTKNGIVEKLRYELIIDNNSILITKDNTTNHFDIENLENDFLFLRMLSTDKVLIFANQTKYKDILKSQIKEIAYRNL
ncbi:MAG: hypothetical protein ACKO8L_10520 [Flavobacterium sp.]